jgi:hypothetical protein
MRKISWHYILAIGNVLVAGILLYVGLQETRLHFAGTLSSWDYAAPAQQIAYMINFPAFVLCAAVHALVPVGQPIRNTIFLTCVFGLWYAIGARVASRRLPTICGGKVGAVAIFAFAVMGVAALGFVALSNLSLHPLLGSAGLSWCAFLIWRTSIAIRRKAKEGAGRS